MIAAVALAISGDRRILVSYVPPYRDIPALRAPEDMQFSRPHGSPHRLGVWSFITRKICYSSS